MSATRGKRRAYAAAMIASIRRDSMMCLHAQSLMSRLTLMINGRSERPLRLACQHAHAIRSPRTRSVNHRLPSYETGSGAGARTSNHSVTGNVTGGLRPNCIAGRHERPMGGTPYASDALIPSEARSPLSGCNKEAPQRVKPLIATDQRAARLVLTRGGR